MASRSQQSGSDSLSVQFVPPVPVGTYYAAPDLEPSSDVHQSIFPPRATHTPPAPLTSYASIVCIDQKTISTMPMSLHYWLSSPRILIARSSRNTWRIRCTSLRIHYHRWSSLSMESRALYTRLCVLIIHLHLTMNGAWIICSLPPSALWSSKVILDTQ
jgi:hypothetical protein